MKIHMYLLVMSVLLFGCAKEETIKEFNEVNKMLISGLEEEYHPKMLDRLVIEPKIEYLTGDESQYSFVWYVYDMAPLDEGKYDTISVEKNLDCIISTKFISELDTEYTLAFKATDKKTGIYHIARTKLFASGIFGLGTLFLSEEGGKKRVDFLGKDDHVLVENVFDTEEYSIEKAKKLVFVNPINRFLPHLKEVMILCNSEDGGVLLDPTTFKKKMTIREMVRHETPGIMNPKMQFSGSGVQDYMIYNGLVSSKHISFVDYYDPPFTSISYPGEVELASMPWLILGYEGQYGWTNIGPVFYDNKNNRFLEHAIELRGYLREMNNVPGSAFNCNDVGENMELVCNGALTSEGSGWALMKETTTSTYFTLKFNTKVTFPDIKDKVNCIIDFVGTDKIAMTSAYTSNLGKASFITSDFRANNGIMMFATDKKIYSLNIVQASALSPGNIESLMIDLSVEDNNIEITGIEFFENQLRATIINHSLPNKKGGVIFYEITTQGGLHLTKVYEKQGFCDKVIDIEEKRS